MHFSDIQSCEALLRQRLPAALQPLLDDPPLQTLAWDFFRQHEVQVDVLRCDLLHPVISGNKWYKLKYNLVRAWQEQKTVLASFGGAWSNHLHALAWCAQQGGFASTGFVRGEELAANANPMLQDAARWGMQLHFISRTRYRQKAVQVSADTLLIPEGGDNPEGALGCTTLIPAGLAEKYAAVLVAAGTGCTALGIRLALPATSTLWVAPVLKAGGLENVWRQRLQQMQDAGTGPVQWWADAAGGGYGKVTADLLSFIQDFGNNTGLSLDPVYGGKAMQALCNRIRQQSVPAGTRVLFVHTGGLQGARGFQPGQR